MLQLGRGRYMKRGEKTTAVTRPQSVQEEAGEMGSGLKPPKGLVSSLPAKSDQFLEVISLSVVNSQLWFQMGNPVLGEGRVHCPCLPMPFRRRHSVGV